jgi:membrane associated rhomboid family serine protease
MHGLAPALVPVLIVAVVIGLASIPVAASVIQRRRDRRRILADGRTADAQIARLTPDTRSGLCQVHFTFEPEAGSAQVECRQRSTLGAAQSIGLAEGSRIRVHYLPKWPRYAFNEALVVAERTLAFKADPAGVGPSATAAPSVHFISFVDPKLGVAPANGFRWSGDGDIAIGGELVQFTARRARPFWFPKRIQARFPLSAVANVEVFENTVRCELAETGMKSKSVQFWAVSADEAKAIGAQLPDGKTASFAPQLAEQAAFQAKLREVTPRAPVTPVIIALNALMFLIAVALGGGIMVPNVEVLIRLGSDYTPLTAGGEWWRLLTSTFLHFGLLHLAFNMWALWVNGIVTERLYGSSRYLLIYLVAGVAGSVTSFLWHPFVNGAGASGAIFGVLGAVLAYFLRTDTGIAKSVLVKQRNAAGLFIVVSILNAARFPGIDNAAHLGGLAAGFVLGLLLCRPLEARREEEDWTGQWVRALTVVVGSALVVGYSLTNGQLRPRVIRDPSGRAILPAELLPPPRTFGGVTLGMTEAQVLAVKGKPVQQRPADWFYNSIDEAHDGLLEVVFTTPEVPNAPIVRAVVFWGRREAEPPEMADLLPLNRDGLEARYGRPRGDRTVAPNFTYLYFANGIVVCLEGDRVKAYGVFNPLISWYVTPRIGPNDRFAVATRSIDHVETA